jgi:hypothetical protein
MQIKIKTYDETRENRVSVEVPEGQRFDIELSGEYRITNRVIDGAPSTERLYTAEEVGDLQASEAELVAAPLRTRINALENQVVNLDSDRMTERARADRNREWAERAEAKLAEAKGLLEHAFYSLTREELVAKLRAIKHIVSSDNRA